MAHFDGWDSTALKLEPLRGDSLLLPLNSQKFLVLILLTTEEWKAGSTFEPQIKLARKHIKLRTYYGQKCRCAFHPIYTARDFDRQYHWKESITILESLHENKDQWTAPPETIFLVDVFRCTSLSVRLQNTSINNISGMNHRYFSSKYPLTKGESMWDYHFWFVEVRCSPY